MKMIGINSLLRRGLCARLVRRWDVRNWLLILALSSAAASPAVAQILERVSVNASGQEGNDESTRASISSDGRYVAFSSKADDLVAGDSNLMRDIFVHDRITGTIVRVSVGSNGIQADGKSDRPSISGDGRYVAFYSDATNLIDIDANLARDIFVHDRDPDENGILNEGNGITSLVSIGTNGFRGLDSSTRPAISGDGRFVAFRTSATTLVPQDTNGSDDILVHNLLSGTTVRVNVDSTGQQAQDGNSDRPTLSADGRFVAFYSDASNLVPDDEPTFDSFSCPACTGVRDIFLRDRDPDENSIFDEGNGTTARISVSSAGAAANGPSTRPAISADGRFVVFKSSATNLVTGDINAVDDVFLHDTQTADTVRVSVTVGGTGANGESSVPAISGDGGYIAFRSVATNLIPGVGNGFEQIYVVNRQTMATTAVSTSTSGLLGNNHSSRPRLSADARFVAFYSDASSLVTGDTNLVRDVFVRDLDADGDSLFEGSDNCPSHANTNQADLDSDGNGDVCDDDRDGDGFPNQVDGCPEDKNKSGPQDCGCGIMETDSDGDGSADCIDQCPDDPAKIDPGVCGCGMLDLDGNGDGSMGCVDLCPDDPDKLEPGTCGCGTPDIDSDADGVLNCLDNCVHTSNAAQVDTDGDGVGNACDDNDADGVLDSEDNCLLASNSAQSDMDDDGVGDICDNCPTMRNADQSDLDSDGIGDECATDTGEDGGPVAPAPLPDEDGVPEEGSQSSSPCGALGMVGLPFIFLGLSVMHWRRR